jgi:hypothetical protein
MILKMGNGLVRLGRCAVPPLLAALALGSCGPARDQFAPACPIPGLVKPLAELTRYRTGAQDYRDLVIQAQISNVVGKCEPGDTKNTIVATAQVVVDATRGPAMEGDALTVPVFIAVTDEGGVRDKKLFSLPVVFAHNVDTAQAVSNEIRMEIPVTPQKSGAAYGIIGGFQLTPEEVAAWRRNNHR